MSTITRNTTSSSLRGPYIGSRRSRHYFNNYLTSSLSSPFLPFQSNEEAHSSNGKTTDALHTQQEERTPIKYLTSPIPLYEQQLHFETEQKAKGCYPTASSSFSSHFLVPTTHNTTLLSDYKYSLPSFVKEQPYSNHSFHRNDQHLVSHDNNRNNKSDSFSKTGNRDHEKPKGPSKFSDLNDITEENNSLSSSYSISETLVESNDPNNNKNNNYYQSHHLTSTPIASSYSFYRPTTNTNSFSSLPSNKNNISKPLPLTFDSLGNHSSTISTTGLITELQRRTNDLNAINMSTLASGRQSTSFRGAPALSHSYDQRITDQGNKYIIQLKTDEYHENEFKITPRYSQNQLIVDAKHREEDSMGGYVHRELHKLFNIPKYIDINQYSYSYDKEARELTIEMPHLPNLSTTNESTFVSSIHDNRTENISPRILNRSDYYKDSNNTCGIGSNVDDSSSLTRNTSSHPVYENLGTTTKPFDFDLFHRSAFRPQIVQTTSNDKKLVMTLDLSDYQPEDIKVSVKDRELIVRAERKIETDTRKSRTSFFQSTNLPPQADTEQLRSNFMDGKLSIEAPYMEQNNSDQRIPTVHWKCATNSHGRKPDSDHPRQMRTETMTEVVRRRRF